MHACQPAAAAFTATNYSHPSSSTSGRGEIERGKKAKLFIYLFYTFLLSSLTLLINADVPLAGTLGRLAGWLVGR